MNRKLALTPAHALVWIAATLAAGCGGSPSGTNASDRGAGREANTPLSALTGRCDVATYPSLEWTQCEVENVAVSGVGAVAHADLLPGIAAASAAYQATKLSTILADPERQPLVNTTCITANPLCAPDPRLQGWADGSGLVETVVFTSRSGGTISGHIWATRSGPAKRPGIVFINGSVVTFEHAYHFVVQALAKAGFVVMSFDPQGEGMSDQLGEAPDQTEDAFAGTFVLGLLGPEPPSGYGLGGNGLPFYDGGTDALDFFLSTPDHPYVPVPSRSSGTSHAAKQERRVAAGLNNAYNPFWEMLDPTRLGFAGHSYGAEATSWLVQQDPRVTTGVAWDALCIPVSPSPDEISAQTNAPVNAVGGAVSSPFAYGLAPECFGAPAGPAPRITKPVLSITGDYLFAPTPYPTPTNPDDKSRGALEYARLGVDTGSIVIRGGTHIDFTDSLIGLPVSLRGIDLMTWYTTAWFTRYLLHDPKADAMLQTSRWRDDAAGGAVDPAGDSNLYSWHYRSWMNIGLADGGHFRCEDLRRGCVGQTDRPADGGPADYSFVAVDTAPDGP